ncbi:MAG: PD-(D/E)XK nuclease family protein, partial [Acidobacteriia bacterium]|nr:PD-(D/E)XK nuclease family protein [Terriglobia bacterium]
PHHANTVDPDSALVWRSHRAALDLFEEALAEAALAMESARPMSLPEFWRAVKSVLRLKPLRVSDARRNVVHVMSAYEARQWVLPIVFVCGMIEKQFPQIPTGDLFFPDAARHSLQAAGIRVRTARDIDAEERALFDSAVSRATMLVTLTLPEFSSRGERNLPSLFLDSVLARSEMPRIVRPTPRSIPTPPPPPAIRSSGLLATLRERTTRLTASGLESWLQCPFQYFAGRMLSLRTSPPRPEDRLDFRLQGEIVHTVLAEWYADRQPIGPLFERAFEACLERYCVPQGYHTERLRNGMLADLERFAADTQWQRSRFSAATEQKFEFPLQDSFQLAGRIDRIDTDSDGNAYVIDYKYSAAEQVKKKRNGNQLQGPLYLLAAQTALNVRPSGMFFVALKKKVEYVGWSGSGLLNSAPVPPEWAEIAARLGQIGAEIRQGRIAPSPADTDNCRFCDFREICRIEISAPAALALPAET